MSKRIKKKLSRKQSTLITFIVTAVLLAFSIVSVIIGTTRSDAELSTSISIIILSIIGSIMVGVAVDFFLEFVTVPKEKEQILTFLNNKEFTEILYKPNVMCDERKMIFKILQEVDCKFLAKFDEDEKIIVKVTGEDNKEIYDCKISNYSYFIAIFKQKVD